MLRCRRSPESIKLSCLLRYLYPSTASSNSNYVAASKRFHTWEQPRSGSSKHDCFCVLLLLLVSRDTNERDTFARNGTIALDPRQSHAWESNPWVRQPSWTRQSRSSSASHARGRRVRNFSSSAKRSPRYRISRCKRRLRSALKIMEAVFQQWTRYLNGLLCPQNRIYGYDRNFFSVYVHCLI